MPHVYCSICLNLARWMSHSGVVISWVNLCDAQCLSKLCALKLYILELYILNCMYWSSAQLVSVWVTSTLRPFFELHH